MGKFDGFLIASDFDGTLKNDNGKIDECVIEAVRYFQSEGGYFTLSTGRTVQGLCLYDLSLYNAPILCANGSTAYDASKKECIFSFGLGEEGRAFVNHITKRFPQLSIEMYPFGSTYAINLTDLNHRHFSCQGIEYTVTDSADNVPVPWQKCMISGSSELLKEVQSYIERNFSDPTFLPTDGEIVEILKKGVDKGTGLLRLADYLGIRRDKVFAVGDGYNDLEMLVAAAESFVPENGDEKIKAMASHIVRSNNDGAVANVIEILDKKRG